MKNLALGVFSLRMLFISFLFCAIVPVAFAQFYLINFEGIGEVTFVDSVKVHNITRETSLVINGSDTLLLYGTVGILESEPLERIELFPNPSQGNASLVVYASEPGSNTITVIDESGKLVARLNDVSTPGYQTYQIRGLGSGVYLVRTETDGIVRTQRLISTGNLRSHVSIQKLNTNPETIQSTKKSSREIVHMQYNHYDLLLLTCYADIYAVVIPFVATENTTIIADFVPCTDGDGNHYPVVYIGSQIWMARNLATTKYRNGSDIPNVTVGSTWGNLTTGAYVWYGNNIAYKPVYGALYNWYATNPATNGNNELCPEGWRVATDTDYTELATYLSGGTSNGGKLKETGFAHWNSPNTGATNEVGFTALPGGWRGFNANFQSMNTYCYLWTGSEQAGNFAWLRNMFHNASNLGRGTVNKAHGLSVRCIKE
jgi:uncharacterized protein (TIGR02145 family)